VYYDILHSYMGYRTCYYRCFTIVMPRVPWSTPTNAAANIWTRRFRWFARAHDGRNRFGMAKAKEFGFPDEEAAFALQYATESVWRSGKSR